MAGDDLGRHLPYPPRVVRRRLDDCRGGTVVGESRITPGAEAALEQVVGDEPTPEFAAQVAEEYQRLLDRLADENLRRVAVWKMEGLTADEIADRLGCSRRTVARKLDTIRIIWSEETP